MREKCCCGLGIGAGVKLIATFDIFLAFAQLGTTIFAYQISNILSNYVEQTLVKQHDDFDKAIFQFTEGDDSTFVILLILLIITITTIDVVASFCLLYGVNTTNPVYCKWWYRIRVCLLGLFILYFFIEMSRYHLFLYGILDIIKIFYRIYTLSTVGSYIRRLEKEARRRERMWNRILTPSYPPVGAGTQTEDSASYQFPRYSPNSPSTPLIYQTQRYAQNRHSPAYIQTNSNANYGSAGGIPPSLPSLY